MAKVDFRSPVRKLVAFFQASRDRWKEKCQQAKHQLKLLKRRHSRLENKCDQWRQRLQQSESQRQELLRQVEALSNERAARC